jgi:tetratricopeptide (TPR) repeat protein
VVLMKLPNGRDLLVDASDKEPFVRHQGLFVRSGGYRYVKPVYARDSDEIAHYQTTSENAEVGTARVRPLDFAFVRSQFWYYRGERVEGGLLSAKKTQAGLEAAARYLRTSVRVCPENPLAVYMLGRVHWSQGRAEQARKQFNAADALYSRFGWIPEGPQEYRALANRPIVEGARR